MGIRAVLHSTADLPWLQILRYEGDAHQDSSPVLRIAFTKKERALYIPEVEVGTESHHNSKKHDKKPLVFDSLLLDFWCFFLRLACLRLLQSDFLQFQVRAFTKQVAQKCKAGKTCWVDVGLMLGVFRSKGNP